MAAAAQPTFANRRRYVNAFKKVSIDTGTPYPCSEDDIKSLTRHDFWRFPDRPKFGGLLSAEEATVQLERFLLPSTVMTNSAIDARERLQKMLLLENTDWGPDLVVKSCHDWDKLFFNRRLKGHVQIEWLSEEVLRTHYTRRFQGLSNQDGLSWRWGHSRIILNADSLLLLPPHDMRPLAEEPSLSDFRFMWSIVLHEFCHAYLQILCGRDYDNNAGAAGFDAFHGEHFQRCIYAVDQSARQLLGIAACRFYPGQGGIPIRTYDVENHIVEPKTSRWTELKKQGYRRVVQTCRHSVRRMILRNSGMFQHPTQPTAI